MRTSGFGRALALGVSATLLALTFNMTASASRTAEDQESNVRIKMSTSLGDITLELDSEKAPISVTNFLHYVDSGYYNDTIFHRVIAGFMVQGGGFAEGLQPKRPDHPPIKNEWRNGLKNKRGTIAMARTRNPDSATSQFFINLVDNNFLDQARDGAAYAVFGKVVDGMDVVDKIAQVKTARVGPNADVPVETIKITNVSRLKKRDAGDDDDDDHDHSDGG